MGFYSFQQASPLSLSSLSFLQTLLPPFFFSFLLSVLLFSIVCFGFCRFLFLCRWCVMGCRYLLTFPPLHSVSTLFLASLPMCISIPTFLFFSPIPPLCIFNFLISLSYSSFFSLPVTERCPVPPLATTQPVLSFIHSPPPPHTALSPP